MVLQQKTIAAEIELDRKPDQQNSCSEPDESRIEGFTNRQPLELEISPGVKGGNRSAQALKVCGKPINQRKHRPDKYDAQEHTVERQTEEIKVKRPAEDGVDKFRTGSWQTWRRQSTSTAQLSTVALATPIANKAKDYKCDAGNKSTLDDLERVIFAFCRVPTLNAIQNAQKKRMEASRMGAVP